MDLLTTLKGSSMEHFYPEGWDLARIDECCSHQPGEVFDRQDFWNRDFNPIMCDDATVFAVMMGHEIAATIKRTKEEGKKLALILPVGPMGMYRWAVYFLKEWGIDATHVYGFNMDEWSDADGNTLDPNNKGAFQNAMQEAFYGPLGELTVPEAQRNFATKTNLPTYPDKIADLKAKGAELVTVYGIGWMCHIAFWEPTFAEEYTDEKEWRSQNYHLGVKLCPLTIEQNALHSFKSRTTQVPAFANSIGPGLFLSSDYCIGGCDGTYERDLMWQGRSFWMTLRYGPTIWIPSSFMPTLPGKLFFIKGLAGPLDADCN